MFASKARKWCALLLSGLVMPAWAQTIPADDFAKHPEAWEVALSPTGTHAAIAVPMPDGMETQLRIVELATGKTQALRFARQQHVTDVVWTADDQVVVSRAKMEPLLARPSSMGELFTSDITGKHQEMLFGWVPDDGVKRGRRKDRGWSQLVKVLHNEPGAALVSFTCWDCGEEPDTVIFKVNTRTGEREEIERDDKSADYEFDQAGEARFRTQWDANDQPLLSWRRNSGDAWAPLPESIAGYTLHTVRFAADNKTAYALISDRNEPEQAYRIDLEAGTRTKLAGRDDMAVAGFMYEGLNGIPFAVYFDAGKPAVEYLNPQSEWAQLHAGMLKSVPGSMVTFRSFSRDGNKVGFSIWSDRDAGSYYVYDRSTKKVQKIVSYKPWLKPDSLAPTRPIEFTNADGQKLFGFYTAKDPGPRPLVVMPHGGPHGPYDSWGYDSDAQFLASRGYAVLQVNFRGSGGRGKAFEESGYREWGGKMMDDIADGVRWAITNKLADPARVCTFGASFGGYAALMQPIRYPELYKCAIGYVGVYDLEVMYKAGDIKSSKSGRRYLERVLGTDEAALAANSPSRNVDKIKIPVMLAQGAIDQRVPMAQFGSLVDAFKKQGTPVETMVASGEGHGFYKPENRAELYNRIEAFLDKNIGH